MRGTKGRRDTAPVKMAPVMPVLLRVALVASVYAQDARHQHSQAVNSFGVTLMKELWSTKQDENVFFSPTSICLALGMLYAGANGTSLSELSSVLGFTGAGLVDRDATLLAYKSLLETSSPNVTLDIANTVLFQSRVEILNEYKRELAEYFQAEARSVDFVRDGARAAAEINEWVRTKTRGKVAKLLGGALPMNTVAFILNAVYFKGTWLTKFKAKKTKPLPFFNYGRNEVNVPTMSLHHRLKYAVLDGLKAKAVEVPYAGNRFSMIIMLPDSNTGLSSFETDLSGAAIDKMIKDMNVRDVKLWMPKFKLESDYNLVPLLRRIGLESVFTNDADLSRITGKKDLCVSDVKHKAVVEVNERGTVAAAVTSVRLIFKSARIQQPPPPVIFRVDHPFAFFIWDNVSQRVLFMGAVKRL